jgi:integrase
LFFKINFFRCIIDELRAWQNVQSADAQLASTAYQNCGMVVTNPLGMYIEPRTFKDYYNQILTASGLGHFTFHALRHTFATRALEQNMNSKTLSTILGHYSVSFTLDTYAHVLDTHKRDGIQLMEELFAPEFTKIRFILL